MCRTHSSTSIACFMNGHTIYQVINTVNEKKEMASAESCNISFSYKSTQDLVSLFNFAWGFVLAVLHVYNIQSERKKKKRGIECQQIRVFKKKSRTRTTSERKRSKDKSEMWLISKGMETRHKHTDTHFAFLIHSEQKSFPNVTTQNLTKRGINAWTLIWWVLTPLHLYVHWMSPCGSHIKRTSSKEISTYCKQKNM